jgi:hypothetical protein
MQQQKPNVKVKPRQPRPVKDTSKQVRAALRLGRFDEAESLTHRKAG